MHTAKVVLFHEEASEDEGFTEWWYGERMTALVKHFIPLWRQMVEDSDVESGARTSIGDFLWDHLPMIHGVEVFTPSGKKLPLCLKFGHYDRQRKVVVFDIESAGQEVKEMFGSFGRDEEWEGYLIFALSDTRAGTLVMRAGRKPVSYLSSIELDELCLLI